MGLKPYQPHRKDFLINTDWGTDRDTVSKEEAQNRGFVLSFLLFLTEDMGTAPMFWGMAMLVSIIYTEKRQDGYLMNLLYNIITRRIKQCSKDG